jgi:hypothetical protein
MGAGIEPGTIGSVAKNSAQLPIEAIGNIIIIIIIIIKAILLDLLTSLPTESALQQASIDCVCD